MNEENMSVFGSSPAPDKEDILFGPGEDWQLNAWIGQLESDWVYSSGFRMAAQHLVMQVCENRTGQDMLIYPIVYLYRHHVELVLKAIVKSASRLLDRELPVRDLKTLGGHGLSELWQAARPLLNSVCERAGSSAFPDNELEGVNSYIKQIHEHDPDGQRFRYATTKTKREGRPFLTHSLSPTLKLINIRTFATAMERMADYLEGIESWFGDLEDAKYEWEQKSGG